METQAITLQTLVFSSPFGWIHLAEIGTHGTPAFPLSPIPPAGFRPQTPKRRLEIIKLLPGKPHGFLALLAALDGSRLDVQRASQGAAFR